ncbi:MAG: hypothetical protein FJ405_12850 [Verrucomicrobia bacterium]|nr:hypothetical protein [Verrucomicrobiota bacterium]
MKKRRKIQAMCLRALVILQFSAAAVWAAPQSAAESRPSSSGKLVERPEPVSIPSGLDSTPAAQARATARGEAAAVSAEVQAQLEKFEAARDSYLKRQKELSEQLRASALTERKKVRAQMEDLRKQWLDASMQLRREAQSRIPDLKNFSKFETLGPTRAAVDEVKRDKRLK